MTLHEQIRQIATERFNEAFANKTPLARLVDFLCRDAFVNQWPEGPATRALRRAASMYDDCNFIPEREPEVP